MKVPRAVTKFNKYVNNPIQRTWAWRFPPWAVIVHTGRTSGREYHTPVVATRRGDELAVMILYGAESDWVRNLLAAGGGAVVRGGHTYALEVPRVAGTASRPVLKARIGAELAGRSRRGRPIET